MVQLVKNNNMNQSLEDVEEHRNRTHTEVLFWSKTRETSIETQIYPLLSPKMGILLK
jgi:hypothetical protein